MRRLGYVFALLVLGCAAVQAQTYPNKPVRTIIPFPAGSATDGMARLVNAHFTKVFGQGLVIENMVGATGSIASRATARAEPDGYTIMFSTNSTHSANSYLYNNLGYDPVANFTPIALLSRAPHALVVRADAPFATFKDFVSYAKANPGKLNFGYGNTGSLAGGAMLNAAAGIKTTAVSYRGTPQAATDLLSGQIDFVVMDVSPTQAHIKAGKLKILAVTGVNRMAQFPEAPTMVELGHPGFVLFSWNGVHGPAGMPAEAVSTLNKAIRDAIKTPEGKRFFDALGAEVADVSSAEFATVVAEQLTRWKDIIELTGLPRQ